MGFRFGMSQRMPYHMKTLQEWVVLLCPLRTKPCTPVLSFPNHGNLPKSRSRCVFQLDAPLYRQTEYWNVGSYLGRVYVSRNVRYPPGETFWPEGRDASPFTSRSSSASILTLLRLYSTASPKHHEWLKSIGAEAVFDYKVLESRSRNL